MPSIEVTTCSACGGGVSRGQFQVPVNVCGRTVDVPAEVARCADCGETFLEPGQMDALMRSAAASIRSEQGLLAPDDIRALRKRLGLTQSAFETLLGVGQKTVVRWERGTVPQSASANALLLLLRDVEGVSGYLATSNRVPLKPVQGYPTFYSLGESLQPTPTIPAGSLDSMFYSTAGVLGAAAVQYAWPTDQSTAVGSQTVSFGQSPPKLTLYRSARVA